MDLFWDNEIISRTSSQMRLGFILVTKYFFTPLTFFFFKKDNEHVQMDLELKIQLKVK